MQVRGWLSDEGDTVVVKLQKASSSSHRSPDITNYSVADIQVSNASAESQFSHSLLYQATIL